MRQSKNLLTVSAAAILFGQIFQGILGDDSYESMTVLMDSLLGTNSGYNPDMRPRHYFSHRVDVSIGFSMVGLLEVDDVKQSFKINGFLLVRWHDERVHWNKTEFDGANHLTPQLSHIWTPRMLMMNNLGDRDMFKEEYSPITVHSNGVVFWMPGGLFEASCVLDMMKYPFDEQICYMLFCAMSHSESHLAFIPMRHNFDTAFLTKNEAWEFMDSKIYVVNVTTIDRQLSSCPTFLLKIKRRASYFVINLILPVILLSFLNNFIFLIPDESGEKIAYGITVLLSLALFLTTVSTMIPRASDNYIPAVTVYLFILLMFSCISVLESIATVFLRHADEEETAHRKAKSMYQRTVKKITNLRRAISKTDHLTVEHRNNSSHQSQEVLTPSHSEANTGDTPTSTNTPPPRNKYHTVAKHINKICFIASITLWSITQGVFFAFVFIF